MGVLSGTLRPRAFKNVKKPLFSAVFRRFLWDGCGNNMVVKLEVFKTVHNTWPAKNGMAAGESYDLLCIDVSNLPEHRMEEMLFYRTKPEERETHYVNGIAKPSQSASPRFGTRTRAAKPPSSGASSRKP